MSRLLAETLDVNVKLSLKRYVALRMVSGEDKVLFFC